MCAGWIPDGLELSIFLLLLLLILLTGCSQNQVKTHIGTTTGAVTGFATCRSLLNSGYELTAACTVLGAWMGSQMWYKNDMKNFFLNEFDLNGVKEV